MNIIRMYKVLFYTTGGREKWSKNSLTVMSFKNCVFTSEPDHLYCLNITGVNVIPPSSVGSTEIPVKIYQKMPGSPNDAKQ